jgi:membrane protein YqaA with SNARE-associated domain
VLHWAHTRYGTPALIFLAVSEASWLPIPVDPLLVALAMGKPRRSLTYSLVCSVSSVVGGCLGYLIGLTLWNPVGAPLLRRLHQLDHQAETVIVRRVEGDRIIICHDTGEEEVVHRFRLHRDPPQASPPVGNRDYERNQTRLDLRVGEPAYLMTDGYHLARAWYEQYGVWVVFIAAFTPVPYIVFSSVSGLAQLNFLAFVVTSIVGRSARFFLVGGLVFAFGRPIRRFIDRYFNLLTIVFVLLVIGVVALVRMLR